MGSQASEVSACDFCPTSNADLMGDGLKVRRSDGVNHPAWNWQNNESFRSLHTGGLHFAYADGSVHFIHDTIALPTYRALATIKGREVVAQP